MKLLIIGATHGDELLGVQLYMRLLEKRSTLLEYVDFILGNPRAYARNVRFVEADLNRSYDSLDPSYESVRASQIDERIAALKPDIVLDIHTTTCVQPTCLIVTSLEGDYKKRYMRSSHISNILLVEPMGDITTVYENVIGYEVAKSAINDALLDMIIEDIRHFVDEVAIGNMKKLYRMFGKIYASEMTSVKQNQLTNFELGPDGYVPVLLGENAYKLNTDYVGFKASKPEEITL